MHTAILEGSIWYCWAGRVVVILEMSRGCCRVNEFACPCGCSLSLPVNMFPHMHFGYPEQSCSEVPARLWLQHVLVWLYHFSRFEMFRRHDRCISTGGELIVSILTDLSQVESGCKGEGGGILCGS